MTAQEETRCGHGLRAKQEPYFGLPGTKIEWWHGLPTETGGTSWSRCDSPPEPSATPRRCYHDAGHRVIHGVRVGFYEGGDVAPLYGGPCDLIAAPHVARAATARAAAPVAPPNEALQTALDLYRQAVKVLRGSVAEVVMDDAEGEALRLRVLETADFGISNAERILAAAGGTDGEALPEPEALCPDCGSLFTGIHNYGCDTRAADAGAAPDDEALIARHERKPHRRLDGTWEVRCAWCGPVWPCDAAVLADRLAALNATITRRDTSIAAFKTDLAAVRAELAEAEEDSDEASRTIARAVEEIERLNAVIAAVRALADQATPGTGTRIAYVTVSALRRALGSSTGRETRGDE